MPMPARIPKPLSILLAPLPTLLTLAVLGGVAWFGYQYDWKIPPLKVLLGQSDTSKAEEEKKEEESKAEGPDAPLAPVKLDSEEMLKTAGVKVEAVKVQSVGEYVKANGEIDFDQNRYAHLSTRASGTAWSVHKNVGDKVKKGEVLALIAAPELAKVKNDLQQTLLLVDTRASLLDRMQTAGTSIPPQQIYSARASLREARIRLFSDQQSLQNLGLTVLADDLAKLNDEQVADRLRTLGIPDALLQQLDPATLTSNLLPMYAPFDSEVIKRDIVIGEMVNPTAPQFILADLSRLWIMLYVHLEDSARVREGQEVTFEQCEPNETMPSAKLKWISAEVDEKTHTVLARAEVPNPDGRLRPHTFGTARIQISQADRLTVPNAALQFDGKSHVVFAAGESDTEFQPVRVKLGPIHDKFTEIVSGIQAGQRIATAGSHVLLSEMLKSRIGGED
jgi:cobalt-zinc-cadmium efflux system membrane fusion protein